MNYRPLVKLTRNWYYVSEFVTCTYKQFYLKKRKYINTAKDARNLASVKEELLHMQKRHTEALFLMEQELLTNHAEANIQFYMRETVSRQKAQIKLVSALLKQVDLRLQVL